MKRREVLAGGITLFGSLATTATFAQPFSIDAKRAAIVIGLDKTPGLPDLRAAVSGAHDVAAFFRQQNFDVFLFTDENDVLVRAHQIGDKIEELVLDQGTLDQLVIYFSGHGTLSGTNEFWLLSKAATRPAEAISVRETAEFARRSGIPNVVLISDACRSVSSSLNLNGVSGQPVFPSATDVNIEVDVDQFFAARAGDVALEFEVETSVRQHEGLFTSAFLKAFRQPDTKVLLR